MSESRRIPPPRVIFNDLALGFRNERQEVLIIVSIIINQSRDNIVGYNPRCALRSGRKTFLKDEVDKWRVFVRTERAVALVETQHLFVQALIGFLNVR